MVGAEMEDDTEFVHDAAVGFVGVGIVLGIVQRAWRKVSELFRKQSRPLHDLVLQIWHFGSCQFISRTTIGFDSCNIFPRFRAYGSEGDHTMEIR